MPSGLGSLDFWEPPTRLIEKNIRPEERDVINASDFGVIAAPFTVNDLGGWLRVKRRD
jgi:hypothetical protein